MQSTSKVQAFIDRISALPAGSGVSLDAALQPSLEEEAELRRLFAMDRTNARLSDPHVGLVDVFAAPSAIRTTRARVVDGPEDLDAKYVMPIADSHRRAEGMPCTVADLEEFKKNWSIFTEGSLSQLLNWNNVVAAGGSVLACLSPVPKRNKASKRKIRTYFHSKAYPTSDVDLFLWGLTPEQAEIKIKEIYEAVRDSVPWDVTCIRTKHTISIHSQYPYRSVQIVLRLYQSPAEILAGFDIDAPCNRVWANPRAVVAMMRQCNTVDMTRRSPSYEVRLAKYSQRHFEVYVPTLERSKIDPTIYERSIARTEGLARLLSLEKLTTDNLRNTFLEARRELRGRRLAAALQRPRRRTRKYKGDIKSDKGDASVLVEVNNYDVTALHIPYGPGWDAKRIDKLVYQTDLATFNPQNKGRRLHRHPAFFGKIDECIEDCCGNCPKPIDEDERKLQAEEDEVYIRGRIRQVHSCVFLLIFYIKTCLCRFIDENPGRQSITGSFKPIDVGEWSEQVYIKPTLALFNAIASHDRATVQQIISSSSSLPEQDSEGGAININQRDHVGRTALHVAIFSKATDIALDLIDAGARITARIADGRAPLHLAAQADLKEVVSKLLERSAYNREEMQKRSGYEVSNDNGAMNVQDEIERPSSEDDWSSHDDEDVVMSADSDDEDDKDEGTKKRGSTNEDTEVETAENEINVEEENQPDIIDVNEFDWDYGFSALSYAILFASIPTISTLISNGADVKLASSSTNRKTPLHPLTLTILRPAESDEEEKDACAVAECLLKAGATSTTADTDQMCTIFHCAVAAGRTRLVETLLRYDPHAHAAVDFPMFQNHRFVCFPLASAVANRHYALVALLLAYGAKLELDERDISRAMAAASPNIVREMNHYRYNHVTNYLQLAYQPIELTLKNHDDLGKLLLNLGAPINIAILESCGMNYGAGGRMTVKDWVDMMVSALSRRIEDKKSESAQKKLEDTVTPSFSGGLDKGWSIFFRDQLTVVSQFKANEPWRISEHARIARQEKDTIAQMEDLKEYFTEMQTLLADKGAKSWQELFPDIETHATTTADGHGSWKDGQHQTTSAKRTVSYTTLSGQNRSGYGHYYSRKVPEHLLPAYDELFEACYAGDNETIQRLCLPSNGYETVDGPLNISVRIVNSSTDDCENLGKSFSISLQTGRRWSTAKFILAVAIAQYHPNDKRDRIKSDLNIQLEEDDDSDAASDASGESNATVEPINFINIVTRKSTVQSPVPPGAMLTDAEVEWVYHPPSTSPFSSALPMLMRATALEKAVAEHDLDAFTHIIDLYNILPEKLRKVEFGTKVLRCILSHNQVQMLDAYIRRTAVGVDVAVIKRSLSIGNDNGNVARSKIQGEQPVPLPTSTTNDANKVYAGLNVHGKKRLDLARKNDPDASDFDDDSDAEGRRDIPLLWQAIQVGAKEIIAYLRSERVYEAYDAYINAHAPSQDKARLLNYYLLGDKTKPEGRMSPSTKMNWEAKMKREAKARLAGLLGWTINALGESPLAAALITDSVEMIETLEKMEPGLHEKALQTTIKFVGINYLMFAVEANCPPDVIDYLLAKGVSPTERSAHRGWNIYHYICAQNNLTLLAHFLKTLPRDVNEELLMQRSKGRGNTPLHVAIKTGHVELAGTILRYTECVKDHLLARDAHGQTALHAAVRTGRAQTAELIFDVAGRLTASASKGSSSSGSSLQLELLNTEDSVGLTPLEISRNAELAMRVQGARSLYDGVQCGGVQPNGDVDSLIRTRRIVVQRAETKDEKRQREARGSAFYVYVMGARRRVRKDWDMDERGTEECVDELKNMLARLESVGYSASGSALQVEKVKQWITYMDHLISREKEREKERGEEIQMAEEDYERRKKADKGDQLEGEEEENTGIRVQGRTEEWDTLATYFVLEDFVALYKDNITVGTITHNRHLVHLSDVLCSVEATLAKASSAEGLVHEDYSDPDRASQEAYGGRYRRGHRRIQKYGAEGELEKEHDKEEEERRQRKRSMVFEYIALGPDRH
ncbi:hypothetical protein JR316_0005331 [Psilocybe cubensis]|uniref:Uncharacterized protein n=1 Tax=Psilocybe cubensis TaxID=181762 RepID=A0ACB8H6E4_PSICU|nr:hypothetical protein JR316_0005331 [Psilocybe cubensis]KAH9483227.1 hypothetical protein JR316_0005331 [Psilocybe cubensis]